MQTMLAVVAAISPAMAVSTQATGAPVTPRLRKLKLTLTVFAKANTHRKS